ncbi:hypothetical protein LTR62_000853 [Meristemomyces frigidus]|uniref:Protein kinase domain-containing protein n=1 Tax=Meristemomyces frigidus TaxID=1508187 RepID=A0AAN7TP50_9PEZI|nr:hypothetical protein LTR62_000853 [Meristemomyces frigidus]
MALEGSELVGLAKLDADLSPDGLTTRIKYWSASTWGYGSVQEEAVWQRGSRLGAGGFGEVYKEEATAGEQFGAVRAVKIIQKPTLQHRGSIRYDRELEAVAQFSQQKANYTIIQRLGWPAF